MSTPICVVGSINMDLVVRTPRLPVPGETLIGGEFDTYPGGRGANQAVAASRLGAEVSLVGCVGQDTWGTDMRGVLVSEGVRMQAVTARPEARTGVAVVCVLPDGENAIVVSSGANQLLGPEEVDAAREQIRNAKALLLQLEVSQDVLRRAVEIAKSADTEVVLNASPGGEVDEDILEQIDVLVVNESEGRTILERAADDCTPAGLARRLRALGPKLVIITRGARGSLAFDGENVSECAAFSIEAVDTTGSGDAFVGALAVARARGMRLGEALRYANGAGALAATAGGALPSLPTREALDAFLAQR